MRPETLPSRVDAPLENKASRLTVVALLSDRVTIVTAGWVVVLALAATGLHAPPFVVSQVPAGASAPQSGSPAQLPLQLPATQLPATPPQLASTWQAPF